MSTVLVTAATHTGKARGSNEDRLVAGPWVLAPEHGGVAALTCYQGTAMTAVLDGMGGHGAGDCAAATAAEVIASFGPDVGGPEDAAVLVERANRAVYDRMAALPQLAGMGTTLAGLAIVGDQAVLFNVGDSRIYVETDRYLRQASIDDIGAGGGLTQSLGGASAYEPVQAHVITETAVGHRFLLATDGLFGHIDEADLDRCLSDDDETTVHALMRRALDAGGPDNISVVLARLVPDAQGASQ